MKTRKILGAAITVIAAIAYVAYRATTLTSFDSTFNLVAFIIETTCLTAFCTEAVLLSAKVAVKKQSSTEQEIMQAASHVLSTGGTVASAANAGNANSDTKIKTTTQTSISKYTEEIDVVVFAEAASTADLRRNFLSLKGVEGIRNVSVIDPTASSSTKELCEEFDYSCVATFEGAQIDTAQYMVCRGVDVLYPDILEVAKQYDFKGKSWLELRSIYSDEHAFGGKSTVVVEDKRQMVREALSSKACAPWSTGPAIIAADKLDEFDKIVRAQDFFTTCEKNSIHGMITEEIVSEEVSHEQTHAEITWRNLELSYMARSYKAKYSKGQKLLGALTKAFAFFSVTSFVRRLSLICAIAYCIVVPSTLAYVTPAFLITCASLFAAVQLGSILAGDDRAFTTRIREFYFDIEATVWGAYKKAIAKMPEEKKVNLTKRMPFVSALLIAVDLAIVYRVWKESNALPGTEVTGITRNVSMIAGYSLIVSLLLGLSMVVVTQLRKSIRREVSRGAVVNGEPVSMVDLSPGGAGVISTTALEVGTHVKFKSKLSTTSNEPLECSAAVRSCFEKDGTYRIGLEFEELFQEQIDELETYCLITYPHALARNTDGVRERKDTGVSKVNGKAQRRALAYACSFVALGSVFYSNISHWL